MTITSFTLITTLNSCGWGATNLAIVRLFTDIYATDHYGFDETGMSCGDFTISDRPESCQKGSDEARASAASALGVLAPHGQNADTGWFI